MKFSELVDISELHELCASFTSTTGAATAILDLEGNILTSSGWQEICTRFYRAHAGTQCRCRESDTVLAGRLAKGERYWRERLRSCHYPDK
jgi:ligand-binding sensor protein